jgi:decaprenylphospho-beta-D-erythro-pentofuranosid-2-ulose 2-reductase
MKRALIIGATSSLALTLCRQLSSMGWTCDLLGRDAEALRAVAADCSVRYGTDATCILADLHSTPPKLDYSIYQAIFMMAGVITEDIARSMQVNVIAPCQMLHEAAEQMKQRGIEQRKACHIVIVSSVAGDRGRASNYVYGAAKAALTAYASGLRNALFQYGIHVLTVKPGFIDTPMTYNITSPLMGSRERVTSDIIRAMHNRKDVIYTPSFWRLIMLVVRSIPETIFKRLSL